MPGKKKSQDEQTADFQQLQMAEGNIEVKKEYESLQTIYNMRLYTLFIIAISAIDYSFYIMYQTSYFKTWFVIIWGIVAVIQIVDYFALIYKNNKHHINYTGFSFMLYTALILPSIAAVVLGIISYLDNTKDKISIHTALKFKFSAPAFNRGLISVVKHNKQLTIKEMFNVSKSKVQFQYITDIIIHVLLGFYPLFCFIMFFAGCFQWLLDETLTIFYFIVVTLSTVGYGDISFRSTSGGMVLSIAFVITALVYVPIEISAIMQRVQVELHQIQVKKFIADGIVIIAKYDKALASMMRLKIQLWEVELLFLVYYVSNYILKYFATSNADDKFQQIISSWRLFMNYSLTQEGQKYDFDRIRPQSTIQSRYLIFQKGKIEITTCNKRTAMTKINAVEDVQGRSTNSLNKLRQF
ncbi:Ion_transport 2 and transmembrane domain-containing protein [Hexamita inflata]|uniref:Ion transport 2 and transmembrane domain-containing protein n=1 Tax=Hexamita inflata TaxID=28002 RepID=A0AA86QGJ6_9EUKA|nr:Ion transport 2 and transmembrane domain-containing protein [Hexamita inflata]